MKAETYTFPASDGLDIFVYRWLPDPERAPKAVLQIAHGSVEHAKRYEPFAEFLVGHGFAVYANDHRGHGKTAGSVDNLSYFSDRDDGWDLTVQEMHRLTAQIQADHPGLPVFLLGHSMGSLLAREYLLRHGTELRGVLLSGTAGGLVLLVKTMKWVCRGMMRIRGRRHHSPFLHALLYGGFNKKIRNPKTDFDFLTRDEDEVRTYIDDPYCGRTVTIEYAYQMACGVDKLYKPESYSRVPRDLPVLFLSGEEDPVGGTKGKDVKAACRKYLEAGLTDVTLKLYPGARHELLNEINREQVYKDLLDWMNARIEGRKGLGAPVP